MLPRPPGSTLFPYTTLFRSSVSTPSGNVKVRSNFPYEISSCKKSTSFELWLTLRSPLIVRSEEHTSELQSLRHLVCRLLLEKKKKKLQEEISYGNTQLINTL